jgi:hypothetical protein
VTRLSGGCHCGAVRFSAEISEPVELIDCNCSICAKTGYLHLIVSGEDFILERGGEAQSRYAFNTGTAEHLFCKTCGIKSFYRPRSHPDGWSVNWRCIDPGHGIEPAIRPFDGLNWEAARPALDG